MSPPFALRPAVFGIQACRKSECTEWPQNDLNYLSVKSTLYILNTHPETQILLRFALRPAVFDIQPCRKSDMHQMTPEGP